MTNNFNLQNILFNKFKPCKKFDIYFLNDININS